MNIVYCQSTKLKNTNPSKIFFQITTSTSCGIMPFSLKWFLFSQSHVWLFENPWAEENEVSLSFTISWSLLKFISIVSMMPSNHLILCHPYLLLPSIFPSIRIFSNEPAHCIKWPKYRSFNSVLPTNTLEWFPLGMTALISLLPKGFSRVFYSTAVQKHQFFGSQPSLRSNTHIHTWLLEKP